MTISNGSTITSADLNGLFSSPSYPYNSMQRLIWDRQKVPKGFVLPLQFANVFSTTPAEKRTRTFVVPRDSYIETVVVHCGDVNATVTVDVTGNGAMANWPISITQAVGSGLVDVTRTWFNNASTKALDRGFRLMNQGSNCTVVVSSTKTTGSSVITVELILRQFLGR